MQPLSLCEASVRIHASKTRECPRVRRVPTDQFVTAHFLYLERPSSNVLAVTAHRLRTEVSSASVTPGITTLCTDALEIEPVGQEPCRPSISAGRAKNNELRSMRRRNSELRSCTRLSTTLITSMERSSSRIARYGTSPAYFLARDENDVFDLEIARLLGSPSLRQN